MNRRRFDSGRRQIYHPRAMGQRTLCHRLLCLFLPAAGLAACDRLPSAASTQPAPATRPATIASLSPAVTDILLGMNAGDRLVAISNWDPRDAAETRPRVGDYQTVDWERLASLRPSVMAVQFAPDKIPPGLRERAAALGIDVLNVKINRLDDVFTTIRQLGEALHDTEGARVAEAALRAQIDRVRERVAGKPRVRTLLSCDANPFAVVGRDTFLDDLLTVAGGENVLPPGGADYPTIDRERLAALAPDAVLQLLPGVAPQTVRVAEQFWPTMPDLPAVRNRRVVLMTEPKLLLPGYCCGETAERFAERLHPRPPGLPHNDATPTAPSEARP